MMNLNWSRDRESVNPSLLNARVSSVALIASLAMCANFACAMDLQTAVQIALESNPEIAESAANRRAIDFEYEQARRLNKPSVILEGRFGPEWVDSRTTRLLGNDEDVLFGRQASATIRQNLMSFGRNNAERDRQASRVDAAAFRVKERSELVSLDVVQAYLDTMRLREIVDFADKNVAFHEAKVSEITRGVSGGVKSESDAQQARERLSAAKISRSETEEAIDIAEADFRRVVGRNIGRTVSPPSVLAQVPKTLEQAIGQARINNPTLHIANTDLDTARAQYRAAKADLKPELLFEVVGRAGDDIGGFRDNSNDVRAQMRLQYEFRGGIKSSVVQEQINRVDEARARIMSLERNVEKLVRESWAIRNRTSRRVTDLQIQVSEGTNLLDSYTREFSVNRRTLLDILDAEASLFQAQTSLTTARYADLFAQYRLLAATGTLLDAFNVSAPREADTSLRAIEKVEPTPPADTEPRRYPDHMDDTMGDLRSTMSAVSEMGTDSKNFDVADVKINPITRKSPSPEEAKKAMAALDALFDPKPVTSETIVKTAALTVDMGPAASPSLSEGAVSIMTNDSIISRPTIADMPQQVSASSATPTPTQRVEIYEASPAIMQAAARDDEAVLTSPAHISGATSSASRIPTHHIVVAGDTLYNIAKRNSISVAALKALNSLAETNTIKVGQTLIVSRPFVQKSASLHASSFSSEEKNRPAAMPTGQIFGGGSAVKVNQSEFDALRIKRGAKHYAQMNAVFHGNMIYLLE